MGAYDDLIPGVDEKTGAPAKVRWAVGSAPEQDRLKTLQGYFPDAQPAPNNNFVFKNPLTGKQTLYNPPGLDLGDYPSVAREGAEMAGGTIGGLVAAPTAALGGAGLLAESAAIGGGAAAGGQIHDLIRKYVMGQPDTVTPAQNFQKEGEDFAYNAGGAAAGMGAAAAGKLLVKETPGALGDLVRSIFIKEHPAQRLEDLAGTNVTPQANLISDRNVIGKSTVALSNLPTATGVIQEAAGRTANEVGAEADRVANAYAGASIPKEVQASGWTGGSKEATGSALRQAAQNAATQFKGQQEKLYNAAFDTLGAETPVPLTASGQLLNDLQGLVEKAGPGNLPGAESVLKRVQKLVAPAETGASADISKFTNDPALQAQIAAKLGEDTTTAKAYPLKILREIRTEIGQDLNNPVLAGSSGSENDRLKQLYAAVSQDLGSAVSQNLQGAKLLQQADLFTKNGMQNTIPILERITKAKLDSQAYDAAMTLSKDGGQVLRNLRANMAPEDFDVLSGAVLGRMGRSVPGAQNAAGEGFSSATFLTNWNKLSPEAKNTLFTGGQYKDLAPQLDRLTRVVEMAKNTDRFANTSQTAGTIGYMRFFGAGQVAGLFVAPFTSAASLIAPYASAKLLTNPNFAKWLATTSEKALSDPHVQSQIPGMLGRLAGIAAQPGMAEPVKEYQDAVLKGGQSTPQNQTPKGMYDDLLPTGNAVPANQAP